MLDLIRKFRARERKIKFGEFHCPVGDVEAEIFPMPTYEEKDKYFKNLRAFYGSGGGNFDMYECYKEQEFDERKLSKKEKIAIMSWSNTTRDYSVDCPKMNMETKDDGGCFCVDTNVPGTCLASPNRNRQVGEYYYKWCPYLPNINSENYDENPVANLEDIKK